MNLLKIIFEIIVKTPVYPFWLDSTNEQRANKEMLLCLYGYVLETGAGNCLKKQVALKINKRIKKYIASDFRGWDEKFAEQKSSAKKFGIVSEILYGKTKNENEIDYVCDALALPFKDQTFDCYCSFEVLEHISEPYLFFEEAYRVLKTNGLCITAVPFLYRDHGGIAKDYQRFTKDGFYQLAKKAGFKVETIITYSYFGATLAGLINQFTIRKIIEAGVLAKVLLFPFCPLIFFVSNSIGYLLDHIDRDERFAERYHVVMRKI